jgi:hypothetical protein
MVKLTFVRAHEPPEHSLCDDAYADAPHELVGWHFTCEYRYVSDLTRRRGQILALLDGRGPPIDAENEHFQIKIDKDTTTIKSHDDDPSWGEPCTLPTTWFLDALERWLAFRSTQDASRGVRT